MKKTKFERNLKRIKIYEDLLNSYENGVSIDTIKDMISLDYIKYMRKLKYSYSKIKESYNYNNPTVIEDEEDYLDVERAQEYFTSKIDYIKKYGKDKKNFFDLVIEQKQKYMDEGIDTDSDIDETVIETEKEKEIKKLALELIKKENN